MKYVQPFISNEIPAAIFIFFFTYNLIEQPMFPQNWIKNVT